MGIKAQPSLDSFFSSPNPLHQLGSVCQPKEAPQQLRDELNPGSLKAGLTEGEEAGRVDAWSAGPTKKILQTRKVKSAEEGVIVVDNRVKAQ
jgi:hypothetical protein